MFQQTFVAQATGGRKPLALAVSLILQGAVLAFLAVLPLLLNPGLPHASFRALVLAPLRPHTSPTIDRTAAPALRTPTAQRFLFRPDTVNRFAPVVPKPADIGPAPTIDDPNTNNAAGAGIAILGTTDVLPIPAQKPAPVKVSAPATPKAVRIGGGVAEANLLTRVQPIYPPLARAARVSGTVEFTATISREGYIENLQLLHGHALLVNAARDAILKWRYRPTLLNGQPVEVLTTIIVTFNLN